MIIHHWDVWRKNDYNYKNYVTKNAMILNRTTFDRRPSEV